MRIAVLTGTFPLLSETFILRQITGLLDLGHDVHIFSENRPPGDVPVHAAVREYDLPSRTTYLRIPLSSRWETPAWPPWGLTWLPAGAVPMRNSARLLRAAPVLARCLLRTPKLAVEAVLPSKYGYRAASLSALYRLDALSSARGKFEVAHAHFGPVGDNFRFVRELWGTPLVVSFHGYEFSAWPRRHGTDVFKNLFAAVDAVTANSDHTRGRLLALGCPPEKVRKLPVGLDPREFPFRERPAGEGDVRLLSVGRLVEKKGFEYALRAVALLRERYPSLRYTIVGDGPLRAELEDLAHRLGVERMVAFRGAAGGAEVRALMSQSHIFVAASVTATDGDEEGQGLVLAEAQATGLPVVATHHNGFPESIVPDRSGYLVPERDPAALAERLAFLLDHPERWPEMGRAGRALVEERFDIRKLNLALVAIYEEAITNRGGREK